MKIKFILSAIVAIPFIATISCAPKRIVVPVVISASDKSASEKLFDEINAYRASKGKPPFERHAGLDRLAQGHSEFLRQNRGKFTLEGKNISHDGFDARAAIVRAKFNMPDLEENIAAGPRGTSISKVWIGSKPHEQALSADNEFTGIGVVVDKDGMIFATELFGTPGSAHMMLQERFGAY